MTATITYYGGPWDGMTRPHPAAGSKRGPATMEYATAVPKNGSPCVYELFNDIALATSEETTHRLLAEEWR